MSAIDTGVDGEFDFRGRVYEEERKTHYLSLLSKGGNMTEKNDNTVRQLKALVIDCNGDERIVAISIRKDEKPKDALVRLARTAEAVALRIRKNSSKNPPERGEHP